MKKLALALIAVGALVGTSALAWAADMAVKAPPPAPSAPAYNWTGFYVGGQGGGGWFDNNVTNGPVVLGTGTNFPPGLVHSPEHGSGGLGGIYGGYNYRINQFVVGIDGDYSWASLKGSSSTLGVPVAATGCTVAPCITNDTDKIKWIATATGRLGYAANNWLLFAKAGWAGAGFSGTENNFGNAGANTANGTNSSTRNGWTIGAGAEYGFAPHWSAKLEYDYVQFSSTSYNSTFISTTTGATSIFVRNASSDINLVKAGVAYRF